MFFRKGMTMEKYVVLLETLVDGEPDECTLLEIYDTTEEAYERAQEEFDSLTEEELEDHDVAVGQIKEEDLDDPNDWNSYKMVDIIKVYEKE